MKKTPSEFPKQAPESFPFKAGRGNSLVTMYRNSDRQGDTDYDVFKLPYQHDGQRKFHRFSDYESARTRANEMIDQLVRGDSTAVTLTTADAIIYNRAREFVRPTGQPLDVAANHFAQAVSILGADLVVVAAQEYEQRHRNSQIKLVTEAVQELLLEKERQNRSPRHRATLKSHLQRFAGSFATNIGSVTTSEIDQFLDGLKSGEPLRPVGARTRDNYADSIVTLFEWAKEKRYLTSDFDHHARITRLHNDEDGAIEIYTPEQMAALLAKADAKLIPFLAIGAFAGLRSSEIMRLDWADVRTENGEPCIVVQKGKVKKRGKSRRIVPMSDNLKAWLTPHVKKQGAVWPFCVAYLYEMLRELAPKAQASMRETNSEAALEWKQNALRHSCISYRVATIKNVPQVALESGNSPQMIDSNYRELVTEQDAQRWFSILPPA